MATVRMGIKESATIVVEVLETLQKVDEEELLDILEEIDVEDDAFAEALHTIKQLR